MALQISMEFVPNPNVMLVHVTEEMSECPSQAFQRPLRPSSDKYLAEMGEKGAELVRRILAIPGVVDVSIHPYKLRIEKAPLFQWKKIELRTEKALKQIFGGEREEVNYLSLTEIPISVILTEPFKRLGGFFRNAWHRIPNLRE